MNHAGQVQLSGARPTTLSASELTHFTWKSTSYLLSRNRPNDPDTRVYTGHDNPGGIGHSGAKARFVGRPRPAPGWCRW